ncbi:helix-turn-helix transcriptional regulator [Qiania dongpingensis]|uniref:Helix-turn-helix transcriptional regulator n=1 Tax=Qiania dongpingensis TaxID=2763669 RepID=A0A7G9G5M2_9FIRM|nr:helix-turn-helix transcriptional regulator [Qiania dongpingensis]QNM06104.1 helix-turn-helix transcriptional regulator [Qiania dongpingensis]
MGEKHPTDYYVQFENVDYYLDLGNHISYYRKKAKLTQEQLAKRVGISRSYLSHIEAPNAFQKCSLDTVFKICHALKIEPVQLFLPLP